MVEVEHKINQGWGECKRIAHSAILSWQSAASSEQIKPYRQLRVAASCQLLAASLIFTMRSALGDFADVAWPDT